MASPTAQQSIITACESAFDAWKSDCSGFVKAVASFLGITLSGQANDIVDQIQKAPWTGLQDGVQAKNKADLGFFVIGGLKDQPNGHVVVVVQGPIAHSKYPTAYWGKLGGTGKKNTTINWAWDEHDRDQVIYAFIGLPAK
jgi:hypothetical protein